MLFTHQGFIGTQDVVLSKAWAADLKSLGYVFPARNYDKNGRPSVACTEPAKLPKSYKDAVVLDTSDFILVVEGRRGTRSIAHVQVVVFSKCDSHTLHVLLTVCRTHYH